MTPGIGRPTEDPKCERLEIRLSQSERDLLEYLAQKLHLSLTDTIKKSLELLGKTQDFHETGQLLDAIVIKSITLKKLQSRKPDIINEEEWQQRLKTYQQQLLQSDNQIKFNANQVAELMAKR